MKTRGFVSREPGQQLQAWSFDLSNVGETECLIKVNSCGLCFSDLSMMQNSWGMSKYPLVPGHEIVGEVLEVGSQVTHLKAGDFVGVGWQSGACLHCDDCLRGNENLCSQSKATIADGYGGFAEHAKIDSRFAFVLPRGVDQLHAGPLMCGGITVYSALRNAGLTSGKRVGIIGIGGLGHMAVQFASVLGNHVTVFTSSQDKAEFASRLGAKEAVLTDTALPRSLQGKFDILLNTVNHNLDFAAYLELLGSDGVLSFVGVPPEPLSIPLFPLLIKRRRIMASPIGSRSEIVDMLRVADEFGVKPVIETFPLDQVNDAIQRLRENKIRYRAVLTV